MLRLPTLHTLPFEMAILEYQLVVWLTLLFSLASGKLLGERQLKAINNTHYDYIILGGGTAGLVVASRLSEDPRVTVAVIEAGNFERHNPNVTNSTIIGIAKNTVLDWQYESAPQIYAGNQSLIWSAGKGLGGSTLINGRSLCVPVGADGNRFRHDLYASN